MSKVQMVRAFVNQRLTAAVEEIFGLFERTISEYEEELCRSKEKNERQQKLLDAVLKPEVRLHRADVEQLVVVKVALENNEVECDAVKTSVGSSECATSSDHKGQMQQRKGTQTEWRLDQEDPPEPPHIKEELWTSQEGEQLQGLEEADITKFLFTPVPVKSEDDEEKPQSSQLHQRQTEQMETGADGEDCGGPEPARNSHQDTQANIEYDIEDSHPDPELGPETEDNAETKEPQSGLKSLKINEVFKSDVRGNTENKPFSCSDCGRRFHLECNLKSHVKTHTSNKAFCCSICGQSFSVTKRLKVHMRIHTGYKPFSCSVCGKIFNHKGNLKLHMAIHTAERPFSCSVCGNRFRQKGNLRRHMVVHTQEKKFHCIVCDQRFAWDVQLKRHQCVCPQSTQRHQNQTEWSPSLDQEDPPEPPHIKEELWTSQEGEQLQGLEEADITKFLFTPVPVKSEDDEEKPQSSQLHQRQTEQMETGAIGEDCGGPEPARNSHQDTQANIEYEIEDYHPDPELGPETEDNAETKEPQAGLKSLKINEVFKSDVRGNTETKPFSCSDCGRRFHLECNLKSHVKTHTSNKAFCCSICGQSFSVTKRLKVHMRIHTGYKPFGCSVCGRTFNHKGSLKLHLAIHTAERPFRCSVCGNGFRQKGNLRRHMVIHTQEKKFHCIVCDQRFAWDVQLKRHQCVCPQSTQLHQNQTEWSPSLDQEDPPEPPHIKEELWTSQEGEQLQGLEEADITKFLFTPVPVKSEDDEEKPQSSQLHQRQTEQMETGADGEDCGGPEPARNSHQDTQANIEYEIEDYHPDPELGPVTEDNAETKEPQSGLKSLKINEVFKSDVRGNTENKPFSCSDCGRRFHLESNLKSHVKTHTSNKAFCCSICGKSFSVTKRLKVHMRIHTGYKPFSCSVCGRTFNHKGSLKLHLAIHTAERPFRCSVCGNGFRQNGNLRRHMVIHTQEKKFHCIVCDQRFAWDVQLKRHQCVCPQSTQLHQNQTEQS